MQRRSSIAAIERTSRDQQDRDRQPTPSSVRASSLRRESGNVYALETPVLRPKFNVTPTKKLTEVAFAAVRARTTGRSAFAYAFASTCSPHVSIPPRRCSSFQKSIHVLLSERSIDRSLPKCVAKCTRRHGNPAGADTRGGVAQRECVHSHARSLARVLSTRVRLRGRPRWRDGRGIGAISSAC